MGGRCNAVNPVRNSSTTSASAPIIDENYQKLQEKII